MRISSNWLLWAVFIIALAIGVYSAFTGYKPSQQVIMIQLLGIACGLIAIMRRRGKQ